ncbi:MAG TPA: hypothetical protein VN207_12775 [Ktedonobacteraceae bacterium]|nr:hypothetical protein [Ktedonobacteraceae bacterium]
MTVGGKLGEKLVEAMPRNFGDYTIELDGTFSIPEGIALSSQEQPSKGADGLAQMK